MHAIINPNAQYAAHLDNGDYVIIIGKRNAPVIESVYVAIEMNDDVTDTVHYVMEHVQVNPDFVIRLHGGGFSTTLARENNGEWKATKLAPKQEKLGFHKGQSDAFHLNLHNEVRNEIMAAYANTECKVEIATEKQVDVAIDRYLAALAIVAGAKNNTTHRPTSKCVSAKCKEIVAARQFIDTFGQVGTLVQR